MSAISGGGVGSSGGAGEGAWGKGSGGAGGGLGSGGSAGGGGSENFGGGASSGGRGSGGFPALFVGGAGIRYDAKTNLHYMRFRWFSPDQMRFISKDLLMDENRYAYAGGDPINFYDPFGLWELKIWDGRIIAIKENGDNIQGLRIALGNYRGDLKSAGTDKYDITPAFGADVEKMLREQNERRRGNPNVNCYIFAFGISDLYETVYPNMNLDQIYNLFDWSKNAWKDKILPLENYGLINGKHKTGGSEATYLHALNRELLKIIDPYNASFGDIIAIYSTTVHPALQLGEQNTPRQGEYNWYRLSHFTIYTGIKGKKGMYVLSKNDRSLISIDTLESWESYYKRKNHFNVGTRAFVPVKSPLVNRNCR